VPPLSLRQPMLLLSLWAPDGLFVAKVSADKRTHCGAWQNQSGVDRLN
jgi:hypothetical protein